VTALTPTSLMLAIPPAPTKADLQVIGDYRLVVTTAQGTLTAPSTITYLAPFAISVPAGAVLLATGPQTLTVRSSGFGSTAEAFKAQAVTALLAGRAAPVTWVNDTTVRVAATTAGRPGATATLTVSRRGVSSIGLPLTYVAAIAVSSATTGPSTGGTLVTVNGAGFGGSSVWSVRALDGTVLTTLTRFASAQALNAAASGVFVTADSIAVVKMPAAADAGLSAVALGFSLDQNLYPGASSVTTSRAVFVYSDLA
jgi:IPT/TIG domain-containing protein